MMMFDKTIMEKGRRVLDTWLDQQTLIKIIQTVVFSDQVSRQDVPVRVLERPSEYLLSYYGIDLLAIKEIRKELVLALLQKESTNGIKRFLRRIISIENDLPRSTNDMIEKATLGRWVRGGPSAVAYTQFFGFPDEFAGESFPRYELKPLKEVRAREDWRGLHPYQQVLYEEMQDWYISPGSNGSGILVLPTGTGKTRVAVKLIIEDFNRSYEKIGSIRHNVLWIAHTKELCEQAIETISRMWTMEGRKGQLLNIYRFWEDIDIGHLVGATGVIVAGIQKLARALAEDENRIILQNYLTRRLRLVVIDEAHLADNPSYTGLLDFLSGTGNYEPENIKEWKLLGLTATPFKSDETRTKDLQKLFKEMFNLGTVNSDRLKDMDQLGVYRWMQENRFLSHDVQYRPLYIPSQKPFGLTEREKDYLLQFQDFNDSALKRMSLNIERNDYIIKSVKQAIENEDSRKILLFACSVPHCHMLNWQFTESGIKSMYVTGEMSRQQRAININNFRSQSPDEPIVLINYGILTTGFDDPMIDTIFITRPTCSRVLYHQMVGRGLRGVKNGGNKNGKCLILDIKDNFESFHGFTGVVDFMEEGKNLGLTG